MGKGKESRIFLTDVVRTPQSSAGGTGVGTAGVSLNSKSSDFFDNKGTRIFYWTPNHSVPWHYRAPDIRPVEKASMVSYRTKIRCALFDNFRWCIIDWYGFITNSLRLSILDSLIGFT